MWPHENLSFRFLAVGSLTEGQTQSLHSEFRSLHAERMIPAGCSLSALNVVETLRQVSSYQMWGSFDMQLWLKNFPSTCLIPSWIVLQSETLPSQTSSSSPPLQESGLHRHLRRSLPPLAFSIFPFLVYHPLRRLHS